MAIEGLDPEALKQLVELMAQFNMSAAEATATLDKMTTAQERAANAAAENVTGLREQQALLQANADLAAKNGQSAINHVETEKKKIAILREQAKEAAAMFGANSKQVKQLQAQADAQEENLEAATAAAGGVQNMAATLTGVSDAWKGTTVGKFFQGDFQGNLDLTVKALKDQFSVANMLGSALMKVQESTMAMVFAADSTFASVNQLTNGTGEYNDMIMQTMESNTQFNVDLETAGKAVGDLYEGMSNFTEMTGESQAALVEASAQLNALGIDSASSAANMEVLNAALGMSAEEAIAVQKDFAGMAADLGVSAAKISKDFAANSNVFTAYGDNAVQVFKDTAAAAKATGIEMSALLQITGQFDTFEGAASAAGKLNAILGGGMLNSMDLLNASEEERVRMLIQSVEASGKSWDSMNKFEKQAVANAAGISDMTEANKLFGTSLAEYDKAQQKVEDNAEATKKLEERAAAATSAQDKFKRIMEQFAVAVQPILSAVHFLLDGFLSLNDATGGALIPVMITLLGVVAAVVHWQKIQAMWSGIQTTKAVVQTAATQGLGAATALMNTQTQASAPAAKAAGKGFGSMAKGLNKIGKALIKGGPHMLAFLTALTAIGFAIGMVAGAFAILIWSLKEIVLAFLEMPGAIIPALAGLAAFLGIVIVGLPPLGVAMAAFINALATAVPAMTALAPVLPIIAFSFLMMGAALWVLAQGIKAFIGEGMIGAMLLAAATIVIFGFIMLQAAPVMIAAGLLTGLGAAILGAGLWMLGTGIQQFVGEGMLGAMLLVALTLGLFGILLIFVAMPFIFGGYLVGIGALVLGVGLFALGKGIQQFLGEGMLGAMLLVALTLGLFGILLIFYAYPFILGGYLTGIGAIALGVGLFLLGKGIQQFLGDGMIGAMLTVALTLGVFGYALIFSAIPFILGGTLTGIGAIILGIGLMILAKGISPFEGLIPTMMGLAVALLLFGVLLIPAGISLLVGGIFLLVGAIPAALGLLLLYAGVAPWMGLDFGKLMMLGFTLDKMTDGFMRTGFWLMISGPMLMIGGLTAGIGLFFLAQGVAPWMAMDFNQLMMLGFALAMFAAGILVAGPLLMLAGIPFLIGALLVSPAMAILAAPLAQFAAALAIMAPFAAQLPQMAMGLMMLGFALPIFGFGLFMLGVFASLPFFSTGLSTLIKALYAFGNAMSAIPTEKAVALGQVFQGLAALTDMDNAGDILAEVAWGVWLLARAIDSLPEEKTLALAVASDALTSMIQAAVQLTPEAVEQTNALVVAAGEYAVAQQDMKSADMDPFVQAIKEAMGGGEGGGGGGGKNIVLTIDGREFARAVDAAIDSKHGLDF